MKKILASFLTTSFIILTSVAFARGDSVYIPPLSYDPSIGGPEVPSVLPVGVLGAYIMYFKNNTDSVTMTVSGSISGTPSGDAVIDAGLTNCGSGTLPPGDHCYFYIYITPSTTGPASFTLSVNYTVSGNPSYFDDVIVPINYNAGPTYAYIANSGDDTVFYCEQIAGGILSPCVDSGLGAVFNAPSGVGVPNQTFSGNSYAYVTNAGGSTVDKCEIDTSTGAFTSCVDSGAGSVFNDPTGVDFETVSSTLYAYVTNNGNGSFTQCTVSSSSGSFSSCINSLSSPFSSVRGLTPNSASSGNFYVANSGAGTVLRCNNSTLTPGPRNCFNAAPGASFNTPVDVGLYTATNVHAYVVDPSLNTIWQCDVDSSIGTLSNCASTGSGFDEPQNIIFQTVGGTDYAYVTNASNNTAAVCTINPGPGPSDGNLSCTNTSLNYSIAQPGAVTMQSFDSVDYLYTSNISGGTVSQCQLVSLGHIYCQDSGVGVTFANPENVVFNLNADTNVYAYVMDPNINTLWLCSIDQTTGQFNSCAAAGPIGFNNPVDVVFATVDSVAYAYVSDSSLGIFQCQVASGGAFTNCRDAGLNLTTVPYSQPGGVNFGSFTGGSFVYVADVITDQVYQCAIDATTGLFTTCVDSGASSIFANPLDVVFQTVSSVDYVYVTNGGSSNVTQCTVSTTSGLFSSCTTSATPAVPLTIGFSAASGSLYSYVSVASGGLRLYQCEVGASGALSACVNPFGRPLSMAIQTTTAPQTFAYVPQYTGSGVAICPINTSTGQVTSCADSGLGFKFVAPIDIVFQTISSVTYAYIVDLSLNSVTQCEWNSSTGRLSFCTDSGVSFTGPLGITFDTVGATLYAYVGDSTGNINQCSLGVTGLFTSCTANNGTSYNIPDNIRFHNNRAYITERTENIITMCEINGSGVLNSCVESGANGNIAIPTDLTFYYQDLIGNTNVYIANYDTSGGLPANSVVFCVLDESTGLFNTCADSGAGATLGTPYGLAFRPYVDPRYVYVTGNVGNEVSACILNSDGSFFSCVNSVSYLPIDAPSGIAFFSPS